MTQHHLEAETAVQAPPATVSRTTERPIIVVKIGTSTLMRECTTPKSDTISSAAGSKLQPGSVDLAVSTIGLLVDTLLALRRANYDVILVTSGAVGVGCRELGVKERRKLGPSPTKEERASILAEKQAYAAVGMSVLMRTYDSIFGMANQKIAQVLLSSSDLGQYYQYTNAKTCLTTLLRMGVIPIVNENDTVATEELKYGDNDWLSALVSSTVGAKWLFMLTDIDRLYSANPRRDPNAKPIPYVPNIESLEIDMAGDNTGTQWGTGGMKTKLSSARLATAAGVKVCMIHGRFPARILDFLNETSDPIGTVFEPLDSLSNLERKKWISNCLPPRGEIIISDEASVLIRCHHPLRVSGVIGCNGNFMDHVAVSIKLADGSEIARGISNYSSNSLMQLRGMNAQEIVSEMGFPMSERVVDEADMALLVDYGDRNGGQGNVRNGHA